MLKMESVHGYEELGTYDSRRIPKVANRRGERPIPTMMEAAVLGFPVVESAW